MLVSPWNYSRVFVMFGVCCSSVRIKTWAVDLLLFCFVAAWFVLWRLWHEEEEPSFVSVCNCEATSWCFEAWPNSDVLRVLFSRHPDLFCVSSLLLRRLFVILRKGSISGWISIVTLSRLNPLIRTEYTAADFGDVSFLIPIDAYGWMTQPRLATLASVHWSCLRKSKAETHKANQEIQY